MGAKAVPWVNWALLVRGCRGQAFGFCCSTGFERCLGVQTKLESDYKDPYPRQLEQLPDVSILARLCASFSRASVGKACRFLCCQAGDLRLYASYDSAAFPVLRAGSFSSRPFQGSLRFASIDTVEYAKGYVYYVEEWQWKMDTLPCRRAASAYQWSSCARHARFSGLQGWSCLYALRAERGASMARRSIGAV